MSRITIHCSGCGSKKINRDANAKWNEQTQAWETTHLFDDYYCDDCGHEVDVIEKLHSQEEFA